MDLNKTIFRFRFLGMPVSVSRSVQIGTLALVIVTTALAVFLTNLTPLDSLMAGITATIIYWLSDIFHQYGHFFAAKQIGKPSTGLRLWWILGTTLYPQNEGKLSPNIHVRRAIGGPIASTLILIIFLLLGTAFWSVGGMFQFLIGWGIFINVALFTLGALTPIKISNFQSDGYILLRSWREMRSA